MVKDEAEKKKVAEEKKNKREKKEHDRLMAKIENNKKAEKRRKKTGNKANIKNNRFICYICNEETNHKVSWACCVDCASLCCHQCNVNKPKIFMCNDCLLN